MISSLDWLHRAEPSAARLHRLAAIASVLGWLLLAGLIASQYVGHSSSPYGMCSSPGGRSVACSLLHR